MLDTLLLFTACSRLYPAFPQYVTMPLKQSCLLLPFPLPFLVFFRISELVGQAKHLAGGRLGLLVEHVCLEPSKLRVWLTGSKTDQSQRGEWVELVQVVKSPEVCPVQSMSCYLQVRPQKPGALLIHFDGSPLTRYQFQAVLKRAARYLGWNTSGYSSHSFRIGAATTAALGGMPQETIMLKGRWKSSALQKYVRPNRV